LLIVDFLIVEGKPKLIARKVFIQQSKINNHHFAVA